MGFMSEAALAKFGEALNGYLTKTALAKEFGVSERTIQPLAQSAKRSSVHDRRRHRPFQHRVSP